LRCGFGRGGLGFGFDFLDGFGRLLRLGDDWRRLFCLGSGFRGQALLDGHGYRLRQGIKRGHVEKVMCGEILEDLVEWYPDLVARDWVDQIAEVFGKAFDEFLDGNLDVTAGKLGINGGKREGDGSVIRGEDGGLEDGRGEEPEDRQQMNGNAAFGCCRRDGLRRSGGRGRNLGCGLHGGRGFGGWRRRLLRIGEGYPGCLFGGGWSVALEAEKAEEMAGGGDGLRNRVWSVRRGGRRLVRRRIGRLLYRLAGRRAPFVLDDAGGLDAGLGDLIAGNAVGGGRLGNDEADLFEKLLQWEGDFLFAREGAAIPEYRGTDGREALEGDADAAAGDFFCQLLD
jgi:hypothetical protein